MPATEQYVAAFGKGARAAAGARSTVDLLAALLTPIFGEPLQANGTLTDALPDQARRHIYQHLGREACAQDAICRACQRRFVQPFVQASVWRGAVRIL